MELNKLNKRIEIKNEKQIKILIVICALQHFSMYLYDIADKMKTSFMTWFMDVLIHFVLIFPVIVIYKKYGLHKEEIDFKNRKQYLWAIVMSIPFFTACQIVFGIDINRDGTKIFSGNIIWLFIYYFFVVAICEEFFYRVYVQGELEVILGRFRWLAPIISGTLFGIMHIVNMGPDSALMNTIIGIVIGYMKMYIKNCTFISCVMAHGLYDFIITLI